jgi:hypothetical protein
MKEIALRVFASALLLFTTITVARAELPPKVYIFPHEIYVDGQTRNFTISVNIKNVQASDGLTGVHFRLEYDSLALRPTGEAVEGDFMKSFAPYGTVFEAAMENTGLMLIVRISPNPAGGWDRFPEGNGTLAAVSFGIPGAINSTMRIGDDVAFVRSSWNRADLNSDGKVNILDLSIFAQAFVSRPGQFRWNTNADLDKNQMIDIRDASLIARNFGKTL